MVKKPYRTDVAALDSMADKWPTTIVARSELGKFTGGILDSRTQANLDCKPDKDSIPRFRMNKKIFYEVKDVIAFLKRKIEFNQAESGRVTCWKKSDTDKIITGSKTNN